MQALAQLARDRHPEGYSDKPANLVARDIAAGRADARTVLGLDDAVMRSDERGCGYPGCDSGYLRGRFHLLRPCPVCEQRRVYAALIKEEQLLAPELAELVSEEPAIANE